MKPNNKLVLKLCVLTAAIFSSLLAETPSNGKTTPQKESDVLTAQLLTNDDFEERFEEAVKLCNDRNKLRNAVDQAHLDFYNGRASKQHVDYMLMLYHNAVKLCAEKKEKLKSRLAQQPL